MVEYETMKYDRKGRIGYIMLDRPQSLNAVNDQFESDLYDALLEFDIDDEAWVAILHGAGRCFCAGADIKQRFVQMTPQQQARRTMGTSSEGYLARTINWKPVIAAVHGYALGAGSTILKTTDGGQSWTNLTSGIGSGLNDIHFAPGSNTGFVVGPSGMVRKTTNGGSTWTTIASGVTGTLFSVHFLDANTGFIAGANGVVRKTTIET